MKKRPILAVAIQTQQPGSFALNLTGATRQEVIDILARRLKINYILDPSIRESVTSILTASCNCPTSCRCSAPFGEQVWTRKRADLTVLEKELLAEKKKGSRE